MRQESNHRMSNGERDSVKISNSRALGVIVLIALLFLFQVVTFVVQKVRMRQVAERVPVAESDGGAGGASGISGAGSSVAVGSKTFPFNPNTITEDSLQLLGLSERQAASIIKYRTKGGKFRYKEDFAKMYVVDSALYVAVEEYITLPHRGDALPDKGVSPNRGRNTPSGTKGAQNVPTGSGGSPVGSGDTPTDSTNTLSGRMSNAEYGKKVERNRYVCNLNTADSAALVQLYGIGGYYARKILQYRERLGGSFVDARQLLEIEGFTQERFDRIAGNVVVLEEDVKGFSLLGASKEEMVRHPYIGPYAARGVETYLRLKGKENFSSDLQLLEALVKERVISAQNADKLKEYLLHL
ncbi:MAG: helix-hairpin-helix domain-containing protein [Bacteroidales bacterium]|nr:helix-hairpin-helix domain-containing protein [Bacteroidales bacterium]